MDPEPIPVRLTERDERAPDHTAGPMLQCRTCGAGAPVDEHFCPQCSRILALGRHGDYFTFFGVPRKLVIDLQDLERRFRDLSRRFHPDYFYNASPAERLASLERSSYLNDAYRALRNPVSRIEHLLAIEGLPVVTTQDATAGAEPAGGRVPASLLEEVFALNEELDEIRELRESGADLTTLRARLESSRVPIERRREEHEQRLQELMRRWDALDGASAGDRRATLDALRERLLERNYINNLLASIDREMAALAASAEA
jgi:molecular chaperone HscB